MQQIGPQYGTAGAAAQGGALPGQQPFGVPAVPAGAQGYGQPYPQATQPFPQAGQPMYPQQAAGQGFPGVQQAAMFQQQAQTYGQQPAPQAAPVPPVTAPQYTPSAGYQQGQQQSPQQAMARQLTSIARVLEQLLPVYQMLISEAQACKKAQGGQDTSGADSLLDTLKEGTFHHYASLGAIRRFLMGETSAEVVQALARSVYRLTRAHAEIRPRLEQVVQSAEPELRPALSGLSQATAQGDSLLARTVSAVKATVGEPLWEQAVAAK